MFLKILFIFRDRQKEEERERATLMCQRNIDWLLLVHTPPKQGPARNPGMSLDWESHGDLSLCGPVPNQLSLTGQGCRQHS